MLIHTYLLPNPPQTKNQKPAGSKYHNYQYNSKYYSYTILQTANKPFFTEGTMSSVGYILRGMLIKSILLTIGTHKVTYLIHYGVEMVIIWQQVETNRGLLQK